MRLALLLTLLAAPVFASAAPMGRFGDAGTISPSGGLAVSHTSNAPFNTTSVLFAPTIFYFVRDGVAVGGGVGAAYYKNSGSSAVTAFSVAPALGYNLRLANNISVFPNVRLSFTRTTGGLGTWHQDILIEAPLLVHLGNFFLGAGPYFGPPGDTFGVTTVTGGWF